MVTRKISSESHLFNATSYVANAMGAATPCLVEAIDRFNECDLIACGCLLRESIRRFFVSLAESSGLARPKDGNWTTARKIKALVKIRQFDSEYGKLLLKVLNSCHALAHCEQLPPERVEWCLASAAESMCMAYLYEPRQTRVDDEPLSRGGSEVAL